MQSSWHRRTTGKDAGREKDERERPETQKKEKYKKLGGKAEAFPSPVLSYSTLPGRPEQVSNRAELL